MFDALRQPFTAWPGAWVVHYSSVRNNYAPSQCAHAPTIDFPPLCRQSDVRALLLHPLRVLSLAPGDRRGWEDGARPTPRASCPPRRRLAPGGRNPRRTIRRNGLMRVPPFALQSIGKHASVQCVHNPPRVTSCSRQTTCRVRDPASRGTSNGWSPGRSVETTGAGNPFSRRVHPKRTPWRGNLADSAGVEGASP